MYQCSRCGRQYPTKLEVREVRRPDGSTEVVCGHCRSTSRCEICGLSSSDQGRFGVRKVGRHWKVICHKCAARSRGGEQA